MTRIITGDALEVLRKMPAASFDGVLSDPPYGLQFMGKKWDAALPSEVVWAEVLRVLKPGAPILVFGGARTHHRVMCDIEDAGFEIRDCLMWIYGQGFPKSLNIAQAIDKNKGLTRERYDHPRAGHTTPTFAQDEWTKANHGTRSFKAPLTTEGARWDGYGTALKPAYESIILAMKPCEGTFAENALEHGVAGLNIDGSRIDLNGDYKCAPNGRPSQTGLGDNYDTAKANQPDTVGRWPANIILDAETAALIDEQSGHLVSGNNPATRSADKHRDVYAGWKGAQCVVHRGTDAGGASRFFYCAKASKKERGEGNTHPTVKPLKLLEYLARLILPPNEGAKLLIPFAGSGSEMIAARRAGWKSITGIEREKAYVAIARRRLVATA